MNNADNNSPLTLKEVVVTGGDILATPWATLFSAETSNRVESYSSLFFAEAEKARKYGSLVAVQVFVLLGSATSMYSDNKDIEEPLKPMVVTSNGRSAALSDFENYHLDPLKEILPQVEDNALAARIADILWIRRKDHEAARVAVNAYMLIANAVMDPHHWTEGFNALERAGQIASSLGKSAPERQVVVDYAIQLLEELGGNDPLYLSRNLITMLLEAKAEKPEELALFAERSAGNAEGNRDFHIAANYWALSRTCKLKANDQDGARQSHIREGEAYIQLGLAMEGNPSLDASHWFEKGILALQQAAAPPDQVRDLRTKLREIQSVARQRLGAISTEIPIDPEHINALNKIKGLDFQSAVRFLAQSFSFVSKEDLRQQVLRKREEFVLSGLFRHSILKEDGKKDFVLDPLPLNEEPGEELLNYHMWDHVQFSFAISSWVINYLLGVISLEHPKEQRDLSWLLKNNSFVPSGREAIYERGLQAAFEGDFIVSSHLLVPQLENSFRHILNQHGKVTSFLRQDGTEDEYPLNKIVSTEGFTEIFGESLAFGLRGLLVERAGQNLRNRIAHGLCSTSAFNSSAHLVLLPVCLFLLICGLPTVRTSEGKS